jgi:azurin
VSFWSNTNRTSYLVSLGIYVLILVPAQLPGRAQTGAAGQFLQQLNPLAAQNHFLSKILVNNRTFEEYASWLWSPIVFALLALVLLIAVAAPGLRLEAGRATMFRWQWRRAVGRTARLLVLLVAICTIAALGTSVAWAVQEEQSANPVPPLQITVDMAYQTAKTGDAIFFDTVVTNPLSEPSPPTIVAMNIINLDKEGDVVDPEDWSPERTQYIDQLAPGESATLSWRVNTILDGDYIVYMVAMPEPLARDATSQAVASSGIHLTVMPFTRLNPRGIIPLVIGSPIVLGLGTLAVFAIRRRETEGGGPNTGPLRLSFVAVGVVLALGLLAIIATASQSGASVPVAEPTQAAPAGESGAASGETVALEIDTATDADDFTYDQETLEAPAGSTITLTLNNRTNPDDEVGHNWVLVMPGQEESVLANGIAAGDDNDWLDVNDPGIIAHTKLIEGDESDTITFDAPAPGTYTYLCTFPEHDAGGMRGTLTIQ